MSRDPHSVPWSMSGELWLRRTIWFDWYAFVLFTVGSAASAAFTDWGVMVICFTFAGLFLFDLFIKRDRYVSMLLNKPRTEAGLTTWVRLRPWHTDVYCSCGACVHVANAPWFPNSVDHGGGRYAIVCACGVGYYKLKDLRLVNDMGDSLAGGKDGR